MKDQRMEIIIIDNNNKAKEKRLEKENETASSRINEKPKNDENDKVESNWCFPKRKKH